jgi:UDP-N-acetylmuramyl pentapeptide phosphotransferase/UDP-N-acetylglucosamine-1-phosphate transferase
LDHTQIDRIESGQAVRHDGPQTHLVKTGTPTMGGTLIITAIIVSVRCCGAIWPINMCGYCLGVTVGTGALGFYDDWRKVVYKDPNGVSGTLSKWCGNRPWLWQRACFCFTTPICPATEHLSSFRI